MGDAVAKIRSSVRINSSGPATLTMNMESAKQATGCYLEGLDSAIARRTAPSDGL